MSRHPCILAHLILALVLPTFAPAQEATERDEQQAPAESFLETITVTATRGERSVKDVPGTVSVIDAERIEHEVATDIRDLVRYEPGVYVSNSADRLGPGGFNIRGVGGNRVLTRIDGIPAAEEFAFGHFDVPSYALDLDAIERLEILRGPASSLYGSDALGGVVSFYSKDPLDYLSTDSLYVGLRGSWDGRFDELGSALTLAGGSERWQASAVLTHSSAGERDNQGNVFSRDPGRTAPNPQDRRHVGLLAKLAHSVSESNSLEFAFETLAREADTLVLSSQGRTDLGAIFGFPPSVTWLIEKPSVEGRDEQNRYRLSAEQSLVGWATDQLLWRLYLQSSDSKQRTDEIRSTTLGGGPFGPTSTVEILRQGLLTFEQETFGGEVQGHETFDLGGPQLLTFGASLQRDRFDQLRDRVETDTETGASVEAADGLIFPTKYFPKSRVDEVGLYAQAELSLASSRLTLVPGLRYDSFDLSVDQNDSIYLSGNLGTLAPVESTESAVSPRLGILVALSPGTVLQAQYSHGFRAPPYSAINSGFTHLAGGVSRLPNPDLRPETSDGFEFGLRGSWSRGAYSVTAYTTRYEDFIELITLGLNPETGLIEFQERNVARAEISGVEAATQVAIGDSWMLRSALSWNRGEDSTRSVPLNSIHPPELVVGLRRNWASGRWRAEVVGRFVAAKDTADLDSSSEEQFATPAYQIADLLFGWEIGGGVSLNAGLMNIFDEHYWEWTDALGQLQSSPTLDRYTGPGRNVTIALRYNTQ